MERIIDVDDKTKTFNLIETSWKHGVSDFSERMIFMAKWDSKELYRKAWAMALKYAIDKFELPFDGEIKTINLTVGQLGVLQEMMEDFVEPEDRDAFYTTIERFQEGFMAGYRKYEEETLHLSAKNEEDIYEKQ